MAQMNAAVVTSFAEPPHYQPFEIPTTTDPDEALVQVLAVGLHPRVRSGVGGTHYTSSGELPMIPGVDAVARREDGTLIYFAADDDTLGTMSDWTLADRRRSVELPAGADAGADAMVPLTADAAVTSAALAEAAADVDVVIDYLWSEPAKLAMAAIVGARSDASSPLDWIQIGALTGPTLELPSAWLRGAALRIQGSGQGSVSPRIYLGELPALVAEITAGRIAVDARTAPLSEVESVWGQPEVPGTRTVLVP